MSKIIEPIEEYGLSKKNRPKTLFSKVGIVGCGSKGQVIARMISCAGIEVVFIEVSEERINAAINAIGSELDEMIDRWGMTSGEKRAILSRITGKVGCENLAECDLVIEAIRSKTREHRVEVRKNLFKEIEKYVSPNTIITSNTTTIVITELASDMDHKDRCMGLHFTATSPDASIIEAVRGLHTSDDVFKNIEKFVGMLKKTIIPVEETPGLVSIRLAIALINEASELLIEGVSSKENIDLTMRAGFGAQNGPFEMADKMGLDKVLRWMDNLYAEFGDMKYKASPMIRKLVRANQLGKKTGKGFYTYNEEGKKIG